MKFLSHPRLRVSAVILSLICLPAAAADRITALITVTNAVGVTNGQTFTVNGNTRTFTNAVWNAATQVLTNNTEVGTKTNLLSQIALNPFSQVIAQDNGTNSFKLVGVSGLALTVSPSAGWATVSYSTQAVSTARALQLPFSALPDPASRTNNADDTAVGLNDHSTFSFFENAVLVANLVGKTNAQTISGAKVFSSPGGLWNGSVSNAPHISGNAGGVTNGVYQTPILVSPKSTNFVNYGNAISSVGANSLSEQFGAGAVASADGATAVGAAAQATAPAAVALGNDSQAPGTNSIATGGGNAGGASSTAVGVSAEAAAEKSSAFGTAANAGHLNSTAIGAFSTTTASNQVMLGSPGISVVVQNNLSVGTNASVGGHLSVTSGASFGGPITNSTFTGTNNFPPGADIAFGRLALSSLAAGNNAGIVVGANVFVEVSGPSGAFTINGIAGGRDGKLLILVNQTGQDMTIAHQSGVDPTATNRVISMTGSDRVTTGNGAATLIYSAASSRWLLISFDP